MHSYIFAELFTQLKKNYLKQYCYQFDFKVVLPLDFSFLQTCGIFNFIFSWGVAQK